ncbi:MAG: DUF1343 domain-containing protein [Chloroflexaceae bacterium]|nr:DUF1343 domain-containing protein [Chloroflexaceae bacterium]
MDAPQINLVGLFSPEHGFDSAAQDGVLLTSTLDTRTGLPIHSLYGNGFALRRKCWRRLMCSYVIFKMSGCATIPTCGQFPTFWKRQANMAQKS